MQVHACVCPLIDAVCIECERDVWSHGGRLFKCSFCSSFVCEDDQFEHQASCQKIESENLKCMSCNKLGQYSCLRCKLCFCEEHVRRKGFKYDKNQPLGCPKCSYTLKETKDLSMSTRNYEYGRKGAESDNDSDYGGHYGGSTSAYSGHWENYNAADASSEDEDSDFDPNNGVDGSSEEDEGGGD